MPSATQNFVGLSFNGSCTGGFCGAGYPPDTNGDVGPNNYMQAVNTSIGIFSKTGTPQAAFTYNSFWAGAGTGTPCDANNQTDPVVLYDPLADRFVFMDLAWSNFNTGPYYLCFAVSQTSNPLGNYWFYAIRADDATHPWYPDYPKGAIWPDGIYFSANMFCEQATGCAGGTDSFQEVRVWAFNRTQMEAGQPLQQVIGDTNATTYYTMLPSNLRGVTPPVGTPNYFVSEDQSFFALDVFTFQVVFGGPGSTLSGPTQVSQATYTTPNGAIVPQPNTSTRLDSQDDVLMMQNQYRNIGGAESLWLAHTVQTSSSSNTGIHWAQINVTGGTVVTTPVQEQEYFPDTTLFRWLPSLAVDRAGDMAVGYSVSNASTFPGISYAGRLSTDPPGTLAQGEATLVNGSGSQMVKCGGGPCTGWGDYSAMTVDPVDDCTFWYTNEYYTTSGGNWNTRIGSFKFPSCTGPTPGATSTPTPTPTPAPCVGDCNGNHQVTVDEILTMVNIALGNTPVTACEAGDANHDGQITVDEILTAVNNALNGCPAT